MEKNNIFEGAKFGEKFITRSGEIARFIEKSDKCVRVFIEGYDVIYCDENGLYKPYKYSQHDIVSKYHEEIDEEKLDEFAIKSFEEPGYDGMDPLTWYTQGFRAGYQKAKEE